MSKHPRRNRVITSVIGIVLAIATVFSVYWFAFRDTSPIPSNIRSELTFSPLVIPTGVAGYRTSDYKFTTVENNLKILSFIITTKDTSVSVSEYPQPIE